jgi:hypothetical protein
MICHFNRPPQLKVQNAQPAGFAFAVLTFAFCALPFDLLFMSMTHRGPALRAGCRHVHAPRHGAVDSARDVVFKVLRAANDHHA